MRISRRGTMIAGLICVVVAAAIMVALIPKLQPRQWTAAAVIKHLKSGGLSVENVNTNYAALPQNLDINSPYPCRERLVFNILNVPYNQLFVCDTNLEMAEILLSYGQRPSPPPTIIHNDQTKVALILNSDVTPEAATLYKIALATLGMAYVGPSD